MSRLFSGTPFERPIVCERCGKAVADCRCLHLPEKKKMGERKGGGEKKGYELTPANSTPPKDQVARISVEKRKGGRMVTVVAGLDHPGNDLAKLCTELKQAFSVGGSVQGRTVEIQGEHAEKVAGMLTEKGIKTRVI